jgi:hypothetical protein
MSLTSYEIRIIQDALAAWSSDNKAEQTLAALLVESTRTINPHAAENLEDEFRYEASRDREAIQRRRQLVDEINGKLSKMRNKLESDEWKKAFRVANYPENLKALDRPAAWWPWRRRRPVEGGPPG